MTHDRLANAFEVPSMDAKVEHGAQWIRVTPEVIFKLST
jgi:hypothetical protein